MPGRYIYLYMFRSRVDSLWPFLSDLAEACGLSFLHPIRRALITWSATESAVTRPVTDIHDCVLSGTQIGFQMWWGESVDLFCNHTVAADLSCLTFSLNGVSPTHQTCLITSLRHLVVSAEYRSSVASLIVDTHGQSEDVPWSERILTDFQQGDPFPDLVLISTALPAFISLNREMYTFSTIANNLAVITIVEHAGGI